ncbi:F-box domain-containing protein [Mycena indigotica]|uniref:F-box domain-containing protein n=1 Tax=Mycena indigotica TaxID=2126181 RepID=A0A8H6TE77_9AGAR|nr:F-box domain-containing protein [Mycena indigotica]KAF7315840.1 F-box domain-containing protein [Mycena indigotica]
MCENEQLKRTVVDLSKKLNHFRRKSMAAHLPPEILLGIFNQIVPPPWMLGGIRELTLDSLYSMDLEMKTILCLVCASWNRVATELLYRHVHLRSIGQVAAFSCALETPTGLGAIVRRLDIGCFIPYGYSRLFRNETQQILERCSHLTHFGFVPPSLDPMVDTPYNLSAVPMKNTVTSLAFSPDVDVDVILGLLAQLCANLRALSIPFDHHLYSELEFPQLEELNVFIMAKVRESLPISPPVIWPWSMPLLKRLLLSTMSLDPGRLAWNRFAPLFIDTYGKYLDFLSLRVPSFSSDRPLSCQNIDNTCPRLKHLAIAAMTQSDCEATLDFVNGHPIVEHLDIWCRWTAESRHPRLNAPDEDKLRAAFPSLLTCRFLDASFIYFDRIPLDFPPNPTHEKTLTSSQTPPTVSLPLWWRTIIAFVDPASPNSEYDLNDSVRFADLRIEEDSDSDSEESDSDEDDDTNDEDSASLIQSDYGQDEYSSGDSDSGYDDFDEQLPDCRQQVDRAEALEIFAAICGRNQ